MQIYVVSTIASVLSALIAQNIVRRKKKLGNKFFNLEIILSFLFELLSIMPIFLVSAFRYDVGTDYESYVMMYDHPEWFLRGNKFLNLSIGYLRSNGIDKQYFFLLSSLVICTFFYTAAFSVSDNPALSILLFVVMEDFFVSMNIVRQFVAISIVYIAFIFLTRNKLKTTIILILIASLIHSTSLVALVLIFFKLYYDKHPVTKKSLFLQTIVGCIVIFAFMPIVKSFIVNYTSYGAYLYTDYSTNQYSVATVMLLIYLVITVMMLFFCEFTNDVRFQMFCGGLISNILILVASYNLTGNTYRLTYYFTGILALSFPTILKRIPNKWLRLFVLVAVLVSFTIWTMLLITHNNQNVLPYNYYLPF